MFDLLKINMPKGIPLTEEEVEKRRGEIFIAPLKFLFLGKGKQNAYSN